jgi:membrane protease YdiL (CAAX protease family)
MVSQGGIAQMPGTSEPMAAVAPGNELPQAAPTKGFVLIGVAIAFGWPLVLLIPGVSGLNITNTRDDAVNIVVKWLVVAGLCMIAFRAQRRPPWEFGVRAVRWQDVLAAIGGVIVGIALSGVTNPTVTTSPSVDELQEIAAVSVSLRVALVVTAGICEEFIYRSFAIEELTFLTGKRWLSAALAWVFFTVAHVRLYDWSGALIVPGTLGAVLTALYLWRRNLASCALMHATVDAMFIVILPALVKTA